MTSPLRVVLDTNLVLSALVFPAGRVASLRELWQQQQHPKFRLTLAEQEELLADYLPFCTTIAIPNPPPPVPVCRDPADVPFLQLAVAGQADALVTGDQDLLALGEECDFSILTATQLQQARPSAPSVETFISKESSRFFMLLIRN